MSMSDGTGGEPTDPTPDGAVVPPVPPPEGRRSSAGARTLVLGVALVLVTLAGVLAVASSRSGSPTAARPTIISTPGGLRGGISGEDATPLPDVTLDGFDDGAPVRTTDYRGTPLVVNFWASWCAPCEKELPHFQSIATDLEGAVAFLGVNVQDAPANALDVAKRFDLSYDLAVDPQGRFYSDVRGYGMPTTLFVDRAGTIVYRFTGALEEDRLRELVATHLGVAA